MAFIVGIDLGTSNSAIAATDPDMGSGAAIRDFPVPQLTRPGQVEARPLLPSAVYLAPEHELGEALRLPWQEAPAPVVVGELARDQGGRVPGRVVTSAKSWLCHPGVDRQAPLLPWGAPAEVKRLSPVDASALFLEHLRRAWDAAHPSAPLAEQEVVITVPASFDEASRALTVSAARKAGLEKFALLEEPQAAFYDFTARHRGDLAKALAGMRLVLVVDVGGGTTDFTLVQVDALPEGPAMRRIAVGDHLLLGGDNMDVAVARIAQERIAAQGKKLSAAQWTQLIQQARAAKETLLSDAPPERVTLAVASEGSRLVGGSVTSELTRSEVEAAVVGGFFPATPAGELPQRSTRGVALQELGLPYASDPAITRQLGAFLVAHAEAGKAALGGQGPAPEAALPRPDAILLNGGVFNSPRLANALVDAVSAWWPAAPRIPLLRHDSLDLAVARGAAYYGLTRRGLGRRIGGGAARAYYVRVDSEGAPRAMCLIPRGFEEGQSVELPQRTLTLTLGRPVQFELYSTTADRIEKPGELVDVDETLRPLPPIHTVLTSGAGKTGTAAVHLVATLTEIGTLELSCLTSDAKERWRLEFELRGAQSRAKLTVTESMPAKFSEATESIEHVYGSKPRPVEASDVKGLSRKLEKMLGPREGWRVPVLRELWSALYAGAAKRRRSPEHERLFFQLMGFSLRPGFGYPLDAWRAAQTFTLFPQLVTHHHEKPIWIEFWIMWRRISGGLDDDAQRALWEYLRPHLQRRIPPNPPKQKEKLKGIVPEGLDEMVRTAASLEHLPTDAKVELGGWIAERLQAHTERGGPWAWALGRLGARVPVYGSLHRVVDPETAERWARLLVSLDPGKIDGASFALAQLVRLTGDRARDVQDGLRAEVAAALEKTRAPAQWVTVVREGIALSAEDEVRALGDTLPAGLSLS